MRKSSIKCRCHLEAFCGAESYYATLAHEFPQWTKHPQRLDRAFGRKNWGDEGYSHEELALQSHGRLEPAEK